MFEIDLPTRLNLPSGGGESSGERSTVFTTQLPLSHWVEVIPDPVIADAIRDRLEHAALSFDIVGESYRGVKAKRLAEGGSGAAPASQAAA